jgi:hypothetical protein
MEGFMTDLIHLSGELWHEFVYILPYLAFGVFLEAVIRTFKWHVKIRKVLTHFGIYSILLATLLGVASPLCACATLPLVISLLLGGLPLAPAMALLVASPLMSPASYTSLAKMLGVEWANLIVVCAVLLGLFAGFLTHFLRRYGFNAEQLFRKELPKGDFHDPDYPIEQLRCECGQQLSHRVNRCTHNKFYVFLARFWEGLFKIGKFVVLGLVIEVVASHFIPNLWITDLLSNEGVLHTVGIMFATIPLHLPQLTAAAMVFGFYLPDPGQMIPLAKGPGIALLVGGPVTALPVMAIFISMFKRRVLFLYLGLCIVGTLTLATIFSIFPPF